MFTTILRSFIIYLIALLVMRIMGKRQIAQMQPFELVITLIIADLATVPMSDSNIPLLNGIVPLLTLTIIHFLITLISGNNVKFRRFINGNPMIVIDEKGINEENLKKMYMSICDLIEACRNAGYFNLEDIQYAIVETNGMLSVLPKSSATPVNREDLKINKEDGKLATVVISNGKFFEENLNYLKITSKVVLDFLQKQGEKNEKNVSLFLYYGDSVYLKIYNNKMKYIENVYLV